MTKQIEAVLDELISCALSGSGIEQAKAAAIAMTTKPVACQQELVERVAIAMHYAACAFGSNITHEEAAAKFPWGSLDKRRREGILLMAEAAIASLPTAQAADQWRGIAERYEKALRDIADGDVPKISAEKWRKDGEPSKYDKCPHDRWLFEDCDPCIEDFARAALPPPPVGEGAKP